MQKRHRHAKFIYILLSLAVILAAGFFGACSESGDVSPAGSVTVTVVSGDGFTADRSQQRVERGGDVTFTIDLDEGMFISSCSYTDSEVIETDAGVILVLHNVRYTVRVSIEVKNIGDIFVIGYDLNGGYFADGTEGDSYTVTTDRSHRRANTSTALNVTRDGYTQTGWNTERDGSGEHIGLGSRVTYEEGMTLHAEWEKWTDASCFEYEEEENGSAALTGYSGDAEKIIVPGEIDGLTVDRIAGGFLCGAAAESIVLPRSVVAVEEGAFEGCTVMNLTFSDTLTDVSDASFTSSHVHSVHINAVGSPAHLAENDNSRFADNMDNLILYEDRPRLIFFAGCSMSYGLQSWLMEEAYPGYQTYNVGVIGGTNGYFQMQIIDKFLRDGDVFVHAPEGYSPYQLMTWVDTDARVFMMTEGNYDLMSYADVSDMEMFFGSYKDFVVNREELDPGSYEDSLSDYNDYGDIIIERPYDETVGDISYNNFEISFNSSWLTDYAFARLDGMYGSYAEKGVTVYFSYAPLNAYVAEAARTFYSQTTPEEYEKFFRDRENNGNYTIISDIGDYLFASRYFYDTDYHLNDEGARLRTLQLIEDLSAVL